MKMMDYTWMNQTHSEMFLIFLQSHFLPLHIPREFSQSWNISGIIDTVSFIRYQSRTKWAPCLCFFSQKKGTWLFLQSLSLLDHQGFSQNPWVQSQVLPALHNFFPENVDEDYIKIAIIKMMIFLILMQSLTLEHSSDFLSNSQMLDSHLQCNGPWTNAPMQQDAICNLAILHFAILGTCKVVAFHNL